MEVQALRHTFLDTPIQWCVFHVFRAWWKHIVKEIRVEGNAVEEKRTRVAILADMKGLMWERETIQLHHSLDNFYDAWSNFPAFLQYIQRTWIANDRIKFWTAANQPNIRTNMETNNFVESWHNQLKTVYFDRQPNRRVDRLIYILINEVGLDYQSNIERVIAGLGRMGPLQHEERKRAVRAEAIPLEAAQILVTPSFDNDGALKNACVLSFTKEGLSYTVDVRDNRVIACDCASFT